MRFHFVGKTATWQFRAYARRFAGEDRINLGIRAMLLAVLVQIPSLTRFHAGPPPLASIGIVGGNYYHCRKSALVSHCDSRHTAAACVAVLHAPVRRGVCARERDAADGELPRERDAADGELPRERDAAGGESWRIAKRMRFDRLPI